MESSISNNLTMSAFLRLCVDHGLYHLRNIILMDLVDQSDARVIQVLVRLAGILSSTKLRSIE